MIFSRYKIGYFLMVKRNAMRKNEEQIHVKNNNQKDK
jgi:hypothetical protein